ncbi:MAG: NAD(P)H-hydrate dehydratase [Dokdonella sp.]|nr:NAD(P)H-hydrate dehydratase [Dokdonella sp.]
MADPADTALYTADQVRRIDRAAIERCGIAGYALMQRAAAAAFASLRRRWPDARRLCLLVGAGNNGGDAALVGAAALQAGWSVEAVMTRPPRGEDAGRAHEAYVAAGGRFVGGGQTQLPDADVYVDGLFGTGLDRAPAGADADWIERLNASARPVLALDLPSGLSADTGRPLGPVVRATATMSFVGWKRGLFTAAGADCCGERELATLMLPAAAYAGIEPDARLLDARIADRLGPRAADVNKGSFGHVLAIGGDHGMGGAIRLAAEAALRCGAGRVSVATRAEQIGAINAARPELMAHGVDGLPALAPLLDRADVIALGPGLGQGAWSHALWDRALASALPAVIDADALNLLARLPAAVPAGSVLTPHPGEAARLLGCDAEQVQADRYAAVRRLAAQHRAVVVLKGAGSLIAHPDGRVAVCPWGNSGMASAGMGDVLTGVIAALLAQRLDAWDAARFGVALHARAGDLAAGVQPRGLLAADLFDPLRALVNRFAP